MAVTSIWPVKARADRVLGYVCNPEKTFSKGSEFELSLHQIDNVLQYAANDLKTEKRELVSGLNCNEEHALSQFMKAKDHFGKMDGRVCYHGYQSFAKGEVTARTAHEIGVELARRLWGDRFEVLVATHCNTGIYHNHFVLNSVSFVDGKKFYNSPMDYQRMREESDRLCYEYGLSVIENPSGRGKNYKEWYNEKHGLPTVRSLIRDDIDRAISGSECIEDLIDILKEMGYEIKLVGESGRPLNHPGLRPPGAKNFFRFYNLGEEYDLGSIIGRIQKAKGIDVPFPEAEVIKAKVYRLQHAPRVKAHGIRALYIRYCFELGIIKRYPASVKRVPFSMKEDLLKLEKLDAQVLFLGRSGIETNDDLDDFKKKAFEKLSLLDDSRHALRNELKRLTRAGGTEETETFKAKIAELTSQMREIRKDIETADSIKEHEKEVEEALKMLDSYEQETARKEEEKINEQLFGRSSRTGR